MKTKKFDEKKICEELGFAAVLKGEQKAIFSGRTTLHEVKLPSLLPAKEKTLDFGVYIPKMIQSYDQNSLYVLLKEQKIVKVNPENFEEREDILEGNFTQMALSRTGELATFSRDRKLTLTNLETSSQNEMHLDVEKIDYLEFSPNESKIIGVSSKTVFIINANPLGEIKIFIMKEEVYSPVIANDENTLILGDKKGKLTFWDIKNREQISEVQVHSKPLYFVKLSSDEKLIFTSGIDGKFCSLNFPEFTKELSKKVDDFWIPPTGGNLLIITSDKNLLEKWDLSTNKTEEIGTIDYYINNWYNFIDERNIMILNDDSIVKYDLISKESVKIRLVDDDSDYILTRTMNPDKIYYATGGYAQKVFLWNIKTMKKVREFKGSDHWISAIIFLPSSNVIAAGNWNGTVYFWDIFTGESAISTLKGEKDQGVVSLGTFQNEENVVIGSKLGSIFVYNWRTKTLLATFKAGGTIYKICIVKDQRNMIAVTNEGKISFWSLITYNQLFHYDIKQEIRYFQITADEKYLVYMTAKKEEKDENEKKEEKEEKEKKKIDADNTFIKRNPLVTDDVVVAGPGSEFYYMKYVMDLINNKGKQHKPENDQWIIMPYRINTLHLYSYFNHPNLLKLALDGGGSLFNTNFGENALSFAIKKQFSGCVSAIVSSFGKILKGNSNALNFISNDSIIGLNMLGYPSLNKFYKLIYTPYTGKFVKFVDESMQTPIYYHSKEIYPLESNFLQQGQKRTEGKSVTCMLNFLKSWLACLSGCNV